MNFSVPSFFAFLLLGILATTRTNTANADVNASFDQSYQITWGNDHVKSLNQGKEIQVSLDKTSGAGFESKQSYGSGFFHMRVKSPDKVSSGVVVTFYLSSKGEGRDELDFEFLGNNESKRYTLQTNVFVHGVGNREQKFSLWFDPSADFHDYKILLNQKQIVFYVDDTPIRVFKNNPDLGVGYTTQAMQIMGSIWHPDNWDKIDGGLTDTNWNLAPFIAHYQGFDIDGCQARGSSIQECYSPRYWWNAEKYWKLQPDEQSKLENVRKTYMIYDYCTDKQRFPTPPAECSYNQ
ncbi:hypothetical protein SLA2020_001030 [Shorea laevis]